MSEKGICLKALEVVREASRFIYAQYDMFNEEAVQTKSLNSLVSYVDVESEKILVQGLQDVLPGCGFLTEEQTVSKSDKEFVWIIDPLDGTTNFIHGLPIFSVSVALYQNKEAIVGIVMDVMRDECFYAFKNGGAYLNGKRIYVSDKSTLADCLVATGFPYEVFEYTDTYLGILKRLMPRCRGIRRMGSAAIDLAYTACGRFDAFFEYNLNAWDVAGGAIIVQEAGGTVSDFSLEENFITKREILASNRKAHLEMHRIISNASLI
jgi:myo-inositol-1(or 4)-monophosphatase